MPARLLLALLLCLLGGVCVPQALHAQSGAAQQPDPLATHLMPNRLVIKVLPQFRQLCTPQEIQIPALQKALLALGTVKISPKFPFAKLPTATGDEFRDANLVDLTLIYNIDYTAAVAPEVALEALKGAMGFLAYAEPHVLHLPFYDPQDPDTTNNEFIRLMRCREAWDISKGDSNIVIGIIDTGMQWDHPDLQANVKFNWADPIDGIDNDGDGYVDNFRGWDLAGDSTEARLFPDNDTKPTTSMGQLNHGTLVSGSASAVPDNQIGGVGAGLYCRFLPIKASADRDTRNYAYILTGYEGAVYAADHGANIINLSWGSPSGGQLGQDVVNYCTFNRDALVVAAAGNVQSDIAYFPAAYTNVLSVAGGNGLDEVLTTRNYSIDITAPGRNNTTNLGSTYTFVGTFSSISSPIAAGAAAIVKAHFPTYNALQIGEQLRVTCDDIYQIAANAPHVDKFGKGRVNLYRALTVSSPSIRYQSFTLADGNNNVPEPGDTVSLTGLFRNFLSPTTNLTIFMEVVGATGVTFLRSSVSMGVINTLQTRNNSTLPFQFVIAPSMAANSSVTFRFRYVDGLYTDNQYFTIVLNPTFVNLDVAKAQTTVTSNGKYGFNNYPTNSQGLGFMYNGTNYLYEGGFLVGKSSSRVMNALRQTGTTPSADWLSSSKARLLAPPPVGDQNAVSTFNDLGASSPRRIGISVDLNGIAFRDTANDDFVILRYTLSNSSAFLPQDSLYAGLFADWDLGDNSGDDSAAYDPVRRMAYVYGEGSGRNTHIGTVLLTSTDPVNVYSTSLVSYFLNDSTKFAGLSSGLAAQTADNSDIAQYIAAGPFNLPPGTTHEVAFALVGGSNLNQLRANADAAQRKYNCIVNGSSIFVDLGPDRTACGSVSVDASTPNAVNYQWSNNRVGAQQTFTQSGTYRVTVTDLAGCTVQDEVIITIVPGLTANISAPDTVMAGDVTQFADNTNGATSWRWLFGNGYGSLARNPSYAYPDPGTYTITIIHSNGQCSDTVTRTIVVTPRPASAGDWAGAFGLQVVPNPASDLVLLSLDALAANTPLEVYNPAGQRVVSTTLSTGTTQHQLNTAQWPAGLYFVQVGSTAVKLLVVH